MKTTIHAITALLLLTISARAGAISKVHTDKQKATIDARLDAGQELRVFIGDESLGWSASQPKAAAVTAIIEASSQIRLDDGSLGRGFTFRAGGSTTYVAITPGGTVPFGELVFRTESKVSAKDGIYTFADIRKPDGTLVPVSVRVRTGQSHAK
jgi:hypothetical protein